MSVKKNIIGTAAAGTLATALAFAGAGTAQAAEFDLSGGYLGVDPVVTQDATSSTPPSNGSYVTLPVDGSTSLYFANPSNNSGNARYTSIDGSNQGALEGIQVGGTRTGGAFDQANTEFLWLGWDANVSNVKLRFDAATNELVQNAAHSDLTGFVIDYPASGGGLYDVGGSVVAGGKYLDALDGWLNPVTGEYELDWRTDIESDDIFDGFEAKFHLEGEYYDGDIVEVVE